MIDYVIPWSSDKNLGGCYNRIVRGTQEPFVCLLDGDAVFTTNDFGAFLEEIIKEHSEYDMFTCYTNRVYCKWQVAPCVDTETNDMAYHRQFGSNLRTIYSTEVQDVTDSGLLSGVMMLINPGAWAMVRGCKEDGMLGIDNDIHKRFREAGMRIGLIKGLYVYHWYRNNNKEGHEHLLI